MILVKGLVKTYAGPHGSVIRALGPLNLEVGAGEFVCVVGPSGCGKSTLLRLLAGLEPQTDGLVQIGADVSELSTLNSQPSTHPPVLVFQGDSTFPWMTVLDNVSYGLRVRGVGLKERDATATRMIQLVGLSKFAEAYPYQLSGGMKQRVAIARALANDPDIMLMDEPFGALDEQTRLTLQNELLRIWEGNTIARGAVISTLNSQLSTRKTVVFVTHSIDEAIILGDRVLVMSAAPGSIEAEFAVPFARPREAVSLKRDPAFGELQYQVWKALGAQRGIA